MEVINVNKAVKKLIKLGKTISTMESCTGGGVVNAITNISGASEIIKFSAVTYSNEYKIKMGVGKDIIDKYTVYSIETAMEMSKKISDFTGSDYGVGITGQLNRFDPNNLTKENNIVYISIYDKLDDKYYNKNIRVEEKSRKENKKIVIRNVYDILNGILE